MNGHKFPEFAALQARQVPGFWYLGSPYSKYPAGIEQAFRDVAAIAAGLLRLGVGVFSPIAHSHPVAIHGGLDPHDHKIWLPADRPMMDAACGLIIAQMSGWAESYGLQHEVDVFREAGKPILVLRPDQIKYLSEIRTEREADYVQGNQ